MNNQIAQELSRKTFNVPFRNVSSRVTVPLVRPLHLSFDKGIRYITISKNK